VGGARRGIFHGKKIMPSQQNNYRVSGLSPNNQNPNDTRHGNPFPLYIYMSISNLVAIVPPL